MKTMRFTLVMVFTLMATPVLAEVDEFILDSLRVVEDPDGHANLREGPSLKAKVVGQVASGGVVAIEPELKDGWARLFGQDAREKPRYIHASRLRPVKSWKQTVAGGTSGRVSHAGMEVKVSAAPFVASEHQITREAQGGVKVDGEWPWGQDGGMPRRSLALAVTQNGQAVTVPKAAVQNLFEPGLESLTLLTAGHAGGPVLVVMLNGDGAGGYCVVWAFQQGSYRGRAVFTPF